jgi:F0F1-type ATP synthase membrane subunit b/b'
MMSSRYLFFCFLILIAFSKEVLVFNEEVLILFCFSIFIYLIINYGGDMIASELDSRNKKIKEELDLYKNLKATTLHHLIGYHQKQKLVNFELKQVLGFSKNEVKPIELHYENSINSLVTLNFEERLKRAVISENKVDAAFQKQVFVDLRVYLINSYSVEMNTKKRVEISKNCIKQLQSCFFK